MAPKREQPEGKREPEINQLDINKEGGLTESERLEAKRAEAFAEIERIAAAHPDDQDIFDGVPRIKDFILLAGSVAEIETAMEAFLVSSHAGGRLANVELKPEKVPFKTTEKKMDGKLGAFRNLLGIGIGDKNAVKVRDALREGRFIATIKSKINLNIRDENMNIIGSVTPGAEVTYASMETRIADGKSFVKITAPDGRKGWVAEKFLTAPGVSEFDEKNRGRVQVTEAQAAGMEGQSVVLARDVDFDGKKIKAGGKVILQRCSWRDNKYGYVIKDPKSNNDLFVDWKTLATTDRQNRVDQVLMVEIESRQKFAASFQTSEDYTKKVVPYINRKYGSLSAPPGGIAEARQADTPAGDSRFRRAYAPERDEKEL